MLKILVAIIFLIIDTFLIILILKLKNVVNELESEITNWQKDRMLINSSNEKKEEDIDNEQRETD